MFLFLALACPSPTDTATDSGSTAAEELTYYHDIKPIIDRSCARCHSDGGTAPSFADPRDVVSRATAIAAFVEAGTMPPAAPDPACHDYQNSDRYVLSSEDRATLLSWANGSAALGDSATQRDGPGAIGSIGPFDAELRGEPYQPDFGGDGNDYRCFALPVGNPSPAYLTGLEALIDQSAIVHHVVLFEPSTVSESQRAPEGFSCSGFGESGWSVVGAWASGGTPLQFPEGVGAPIAAGAELILQMHYFNSFDGADQVSDQSGYGLLITDSVDREVTSVPFGPTGFSIPAGSDDYAVSDRARYRGGDADILAAFPHMHQAGVGFHMTVESDPEQCLVDMNGWYFHNQLLPVFKEPLKLSTGDRVTTTCVYDNPDARSVSFGEETGDEMCFGFVWIAPSE
jgi:hypothetical protein